MKKIILLLGLFSLPLWGQKGVHESWGRMLQTYVSANGAVDYVAWKKEASALDAYIVALQTHAPAPEAPQSQWMAYWINAYNALTVQLILQNYPLESIRDLFRPWGREVFQLRGEDYSLGDIEHRILRKMGDPRIHFAINCASASCPQLSREVYESRRLDFQLDRAARQFLNDPTKNNIQEEVWELSKIFLWFGRDFGGRQEKIDRIRDYLGRPGGKTPKIRYLKYDWRLNTTYKPSDIQ